MAIAFDNLTFAVTSATSLTFAHTCTGANLILFLGIQNGGSNVNNITGITYNGVALTKITSVDASAVGGLSQQWDFWYLINPATGSNNVIVSAANNALINAGAISYTGAKQSGQPDAGPVTQLQSLGATNTNTVISVADNCWQIVTGASDGNTDTINSGGIKRGQAGAGALFFFDSNGVIHPAGSHSIVENTSNALSGSLTIGVTISPAPTSQILKVSGVAQASISKVSSVTNANIEKVSGVLNQ